MNDDNLILLGLIGGSIGVALALVFQKQIRQAFGLETPATLSGFEPGSFVTVPAMQLFGRAPNLSQVVQGIF